MLKRELGMVQVLGRLAFTFDNFYTAGLAGWLAKFNSYQTIFLLGLASDVILQIKFLVDGLNIGAA